MIEAEALRLAHSRDGQNILKMVKYAQETGNMPTGDVNFAKVIQLTVHGFIYLAHGCVCLTIKGITEILE